MSADPTESRSNRCTRRSFIKASGAALAGMALTPHILKNVYKTFLTHEFIDALVNERKPAIDIYEALAYTVPGIIAHKSALEGGKQMKVPSFDRKGQYSHHRVRSLQ